MSRLRADRSQKRQRQRDRREVRKAVASPCGRPPAAPTGLTAAYDTKHRLRSTVVRTKLRWDEVSEDTSGFPITIVGYDVELDFSDDSGATWSEDPERFQVPAKTDDDDNTKAHLVVRGVTPDYEYRFRVRSRISKECRSEWSDWEEIGAPLDEDLPPAPEDVTISEHGVDAVKVRWEIADDPHDNQLPHVLVHHFQVQISKFADFSVIYKGDRFVHLQHKNFKVPNADAGDQFYGRVRSISASRNKSKWVHATYDGNSTEEDPGHVDPDPATITLQDGDVGGGGTCEAMALAVTDPTHNQTDFNFDYDTDAWSGDLVVGEGVEYMAIGFETDPGGFFAPEGWLPVGDGLAGGAPYVALYYRPGYVMSGSQNWSWDNTVAFGYVYVAYTGGNSGTEQAQEDGPFDEYDSGEGTTVGTFDATGRVVLAQVGTNDNWAGIASTTGDWDHVESALFDSSGLRLAFSHLEATTAVAADNVWWVQFG